MKLNLGCGTKKMAGFVNVDLRLNPLPTECPEKLFTDPDVIDDVSKLEKFENNTVDLIYNCHVFEHFVRNERLNVLKRWLEVLKPGGTLRMAVPNFAAVAHAYVNKLVPFEKLWSSLNGSQRHPYDFHYHCYDFDHLKQDLESVGFVNVRLYDWRKTEHADVDDYSQSYWPHMDKENGFHLSLNVEADKPQ
jgi:predicted SAM-dependent methyltransferase